MVRKEAVLPTENFSTLNAAFNAVNTCRKDIQRKTFFIQPLRRHHVDGIQLILRQTLFPAVTAIRDHVEAEPRISPAVVLDMLQILSSAVDVAQRYQVFDHDFLQHIAEIYFQSRERAYAVGWDRELLLHVDAYARRFVDLEQNKRRLGSSRDPNIELISSVAWIMNDTVGEYSLEGRNDLSARQKQDIIEAKSYWKTVYESAKKV